MKFSEQTVRERIEEALVDRADSREVWENLGEERRSEYLHWIGSVITRRKFNERTAEVLTILDSAAAAQRVGAPPTPLPPTPYIADGFIGEIIEAVLTSRYFGRRKRNEE
jgi:hypothetical protein